MSTIRLHGIAFRDNLPGRSGLDPATIVPETIPVYAGYDYTTPIGTAALRRDKTGIHADAAVEEGPWQGSCRYFAMSFRVGHLAGVPGAGLGEAVGVSVVTSTGDAGMPPFEIQPEAAR